MSHDHYYLNSRYNDGGCLPQARLLYTGTVRNDPGWFNIPHTHDFCEILYVVSGCGHAQIGDNSCELTPGDLMIVNRGVLHEEKSYPEAPLNLAFCGVENFGIEQGHYPVIPLHAYRQKLEDTLLALINETIGLVRFYPEMCQSLLDMLLILIKRILLSEEASPPNDRQEQCSRIKEFINHNYTSPISLDSLSETVYISKHHLAHIFKNQTGISPIQYLIKKRVSEAERLLRETDQSVAEVGAMVGYDDPVYFSQLFKKSTGLSPSAYRRKLIPL